jgi:hypothetical protein
MYVFMYVVLSEQWSSSSSTSEPDMGMRNHDLVLFNNIPCKVPFVIANHTGLGSPWYSVLAPSNAS